MTPSINCMYNFYGIRLFYLHNWDELTWNPRERIVPWVCWELYPASWKVQTDPAQLIEAPFQTLNWVTEEENVTYSKYKK
jgi:hypothetical protein